MNFMEADGDALAEIRELGEVLEPDGRDRAVCPFCHGGSTHELSLRIVRRDGGVGFDCFRATCGRGGFVSLKGAPRPDRVKRQPDRPMEYPGRTVPVPRRIWESNLKPYGYSRGAATRQGIRYAPAMERLIFPVWNQGGNQIGQVCKTIVGALPKWWSYGKPPMVHWPMRENGLETLSGPLSGYLVLVEDVISAWKVSRLTKCAAVLGGNLTPEQAKSINPAWWPRVIIWPDPDAGGAEFLKHFRKHTSYMFKDWRMIWDMADPKDLTLNQIQGALLKISRAESEV